MSFDPTGRVFAVLVAFFIGAAGCSDASPQKQTKRAEERIESEPVLASEEQPGRSVESQPQNLELDGEEPVEEEVEIPLDQIWALRMPHTRAIDDLEDNKHPRSDHGRLVADIRESLALAPPKGKEAGEAFVVAGRGTEALNEAHAVLAEKKAVHNYLSEGDELSIVFYSYRFGSEVHLDRVEKRGNVIDIGYHFVPHFETYVSEHIALIPIGVLPVGNYEVRILENQMNQKSVATGFKTDNPDWGRRIVSKSFSFSVLKPKAK